MPQSLSRVLIHLVFSTKYREPVLARDIRAELHPYMAVVLHENGCQPLQVGGVEDHVHLLFALSRTITMADIVETVKTSSSKWLKTKSPGLAGLHWQNGYGAFSVSSSAASIVIAYIQRQEEHHRKRKFQAELRTLLRRHKVPWDERYVWD
jgi:REP element-mobilizing transposase RayT